MSRAALHFVLPAGVDDPAQPSGGNTYDRRVAAGLAAAGWTVHEHAVRGGWPDPDPAALAELTGVLAAVPFGESVLVDGLIGCAAPEALVPEAARLRLVLLVHLPLGAVAGSPARAGEAAVLSAAAAVVATSGWTCERLLEWYQLAPGRVHVAHPGVDPTDSAPGTAAGGELLCVAAVAHHKGHDILVDALAAVRELSWQCRFVGPLDRDPRFVDRLRAQVAANRLGDRIELAGPRTGADLDRAYAGADLLVLASLGETYGMVLAEALARGLPVLATDVGGVREALGRPAAGLPGLLVPPGAPAALAAALRSWLTDAELRGRLRGAAAARRATLPTWSDTVERVGAALVSAATSAG
ncbi:MAG: hypothetical protein QOI15_1155 [Pseudonocardiales bacterium]|nr:hypothetical protein [Pseudonocardiales bacterium]